MPPAVVAVISVVASVAIKALAVSAIVKALLTIAVTLAITLLSKKPKANKLNQGQELRTKYDPTMTRQVLTGYIATGGSCHFTYTRTNDGKKPNRYLYRVIQLSDRPIHALIAVMEGSQTLTWSGDLTTGWRSCNQHKTKSGNACMWMRVYLGSDSPIADSTLVSETGGIWTNAHKGTGLAYAIVKMDYDADAFSSGEPELVWVVEGAHLYDDRKDSTKPGGSGAHRVNTYSTWEYSDNAAMITAQTLRGFYTNGELIVGVQAEERDLSTTMLFSAYNTCDQVVTESTGSVARYKAGMIMNANESIADILIDLQAAMDGKIFDRGGAITLLPGANHVPVMSLSDEDLDWSKEKSWQPKASLEQMLNHVTSNFIDSEQNFQERNLPVQQNSSWEADDGGERFSQFFSFRAVNRWGQGQRIVQRIHKASRYNGTIAFVGGVHLLEMEQGDWFTMTSVRWGFVSKYFEVQEIDFTSNTQIAIVAREVSPLIDEWDWAVDEKPREDSIWIPPSYDLPIPNIYASAFLQSDPVSLQESFNIEVGIIGDPALYGSIVKYVEYQYSWGDLSITPSVGIFPVNTPKATIRGLAAGTDYFVRGRLRDDERAGDWTAWILATTDLASIIAAGYGPYLTRPSFTVAANPDGSLPAGSLTSAGGAFVVTKGGVILTSGVVYSVHSESAGLDVSIDPASGVYVVNSFTVDSGVAIFRAVVDGLTIDLAYSIAKSRAGAPAITAYLTKENHSVPANNAGVVSTYSGASGTFVVMQGSANVGSNFTLSSQSNPQGLTVGYVGRDFSITGGFDAGEDIATLTIRATGSGDFTGVVLDKIFTLGKNKIGPTGAGANAVSLNLSTYAMSLWAYANGIVVSFADAWGQAYVYDGDVDVTASATLSMTASTGITATINTAANTPVSGQPKGFYRITALTDVFQAGTMTITAVYAGVTRTAIVSVIKTTAGFQIVSTLPATDLFDGRIVYNTTDKKLYTYISGQGWVYKVPVVDLDGQMGGGNLVRNSSFDGPTYASGNAPSGFALYDNSAGADGTGYGLPAATGRRGGKTFQVYWSQLTDTKGFYFASAGGVDNTNIFAPGQWYVWSFYVYATGNAVGRLMTPAWNNAPTESVPILNPPLASAWQRYAFKLRWNGVTPDPAGFMSIQWVPNSLAAGSIYFDDVQIEEGEYPTAWAPAFAPGEVTNIYLADGAVSDAKVTAIAAAKLTGQIISTQITDGAISTPKLAAGSVTTAKIQADAITANEIAANAVNTTELAADAVIASKIAANAVVAGKIAADAVSATEIQAGAITTTKIAADAVTANEILAGTITAAELASTQLISLSAQIGTLVVDTLHIKNNAVTSANAAFASGTVFASTIGAVVNVGSVVFTASGAPVNIIFGHSHNVSVPSTTASYTIQLTYNGSVIWTSSFGQGSGPLANNWSFQFLHTPSAGSCTYSWDVVFTGGSGLMVWDRSILALEVKK